jgi:hypothetical protein
MPSWSQWLEKVQEGAFKRLPAMNRLDLRSAIDNHQRIINDHMQSVRFLTALADGLPDDETTVLSHYGEAGVTAVYKVANP